MEEGKEPTQYIMTNGWWDDVISYTGGVASGLGLAALFA
jgi:hypothetical protein